MFTASRAMFQKVLKEVPLQIAEYAGRDTKVPNMRNGRCFPTCVELCQSSRETLAQWLQVPRNNVDSIPIRWQNFNKVIDTSRHDFELAFAKQSAETIMTMLDLCEDVPKPINNELLQRLVHGHATEEDDLLPICTAVGMNLLVLNIDHEPIYFLEVKKENPTYKMMLVAGPPENVAAQHFQAVVTLLPFGLLVASRECMEYLGVNMKYNPVAHIRSQLATTTQQMMQQQRQIQKLRTDKLALEARVAALEQAVGSADAARVAALEKQALEKQETRALKISSRVPKPKGKRCPRKMKMARAPSAPSAFVLYKKIDSATAGGKFP